MATRPNFVLVMCDDMDLLLGGVNATPQVKSLLGDGGATAINYFVSSPKCTPVSPLPAPRTGSIIGPVHAAQQERGQ